MNLETQLLRQVHPKFFEDGCLSSQAFTPFPRDDGLLSVYDGDLISASDAYRHFTEVSQLESCGVWSVSGEEVHSVGLSSRPDPLPNFSEHAIIDFTTCSKKDIRKFAKKLRDLASDRGCLHSA